MLFRSPDKRLLQMCPDKKIPIVLSSDAHVPEHVGADFDQALKLAREVGYNEIMTFSKGVRRVYSIG